LNAVLERHSQLTTAAKFSAVNDPHSAVFVCILMAWVTRTLS